ncbi:helix-turn-helix transcriptional regulator [Actinacidiphila bryophytorum]|uniref:AraC family transcriptional regulator n=1 Tax=Actinacidiphila bryophytorum TaxID=1436133 RepID=A0A9W4E100_9ACTN|nr:helix-turn-helix transcriptional regulator [Actinacidiphila bryophytorum]MBM9440944.1 helix-turn-helix transcriptional regulator [Actinacidiphila bryophytorum]MBN6543680.1 helix-turn-helix transcriptional regulator [Actinacidiphila bryophytorum]CAG7612869.1 AraC family transcriptional regulator [Actinacidiphila bryophytorum]
MHTVLARLDEPPALAAVGIGIHGPAGRVDEFELPELWQFHLYGYDADLAVAGTRHTIRPGRISLIPPGTKSRYVYRGRSEHLYVHLRLAARGTPRSLPVIQDAGHEAAALEAQLLQALNAWPHTPARATAEVWAALWRVVELAGRRSAGGPPSSGRPGHPAVAAAAALIEARLAEPLTVPEIARAVGISHNHLTRLFRSATGETVVGYIRARRMERARHFLLATTMSIPAIAASVGIPDLQAFNKACRKELGAGPRAVRAAHPVRWTPGASDGSARR